MKGIFVVSSEPMDFPIRAGVVNKKVRERKNEIKKLLLLLNS
jgi:hypothetical protein